MKEWTLQEAEDFIMNFLMEECSEEELDEARCRELAKKLAKALDQ